MPRKDILEEASTDEIEYLMAIMNDNAINRKKHDRLSDKGTVFLFNKFSLLAAYFGMIFLFLNETQFYFQIVLDIKVGTVSRIHSFKKMLN